MTSTATAPQLLAEAPPALPAFLEVARACATRLAQTAIWHDEQCTWVGSATEPVAGRFQAVQRACGPDVYSGTAGIARFLSQLLTQHPDPVLQPTLEGAVNQLLASPAPPPGSPHYAYYAGALGVASTLLEVGEQQARPDWMAAGQARLRQVCAQPVQATEVDVISGVAGAIPVLLRLQQRHPDPQWAEAATRCGDFLLASASRQPTAWSWVAIPGQPAMTGYSHGAAGIARALLELHHATGNPAYYTGALMGFNFERQLFNPQLQNWPDLRDLAADTPAAAPRPAPTYGDAWCHGAPGIALSRLRAWQLTGDDTLRQEAELALNTTHRGIYNLLNGPAGVANFSLCHGLAGNADILLEGSRVLQNDLYRQVAEAVGAYGIEHFHHPRLAWPSGVNDPSGLTPGRGEAPGLLLGLAGTGYFYLRLATPGQTPSPLL